MKLTRSNIRHLILESISDMVREQADSAMPEAKHIIHTYQNQAQGLKQRQQKSKPTVQTMSDLYLKIVIHFQGSGRKY